MNHFTTRKQFLVPSFELNVKEQEKLDKFFTDFKKSEVAELISIKEI